MNFLNYFFSRVLKIIAAITPGTQPAAVSKIVKRIAPHPLSKTESGGQIIHTIVLKIPIIKFPGLFSKVHASQTIKKKLKQIS